MLTNGCHAVLQLIDFAAGSATTEANYEGQLQQENCQISRNIPNFS